MKTYKHCQSCGMPIKRDEQGGGTEADGTRTSQFCSHCYADGKFKQPDMAVAQMQELVRGKMIEMGFPKFMCGFFTKGIPKLERWQNAR